MFETVALGMINSFTEEVVLKAAYGVWEQFIGTALPLGQGVAAILRTGSLYANNNIANDPRISRLELFQGISALLGVPLIADHGPLGMLVAGRTTPFTEEDSRLLSMRPTSRLERCSALWRTIRRSATPSSWPPSIPSGAHWLSCWTSLRSSSSWPPRFNRFSRTCWRCSSRVTMPHAR